MKVGIITAQYEEVERLVEPIAHKNVVEACGRVFYEFRCDKVEVVVVFSHWGKVAATLTATILQERFQPDCIVSVGLGTAVVPELHLGDIVVGQHLFQHDMDMRPVFRRYEIPLSGMTSYETPTHEQQLATDAVHNLLKQVKDLRKDLLGYGIKAPKLQLGDIACGDLLITGAARKAAINRNLPSVLCVDMESAAIAQVCASYAVPAVFVRTIADTANESDEDANAVRFKNDFVARYNVEIAQSLLGMLGQ